MKILILAYNTKDFLSCAHLVNQYRAHSDRNEIHISCFQESANLAKLIPYVKQVHVVDRKKIQTFKSRQIYSDAHALNLFWNALTPMRSEVWDEIYTYSCDQFTALIASFLNTKKIKGVSFNPNKSLHASSTMAMLKLISQNNASTIHAHDLDTQINSLPFTKGSHLNIDREFINLANENFKIIRKKLAHTKTEVKFVGIQFVGDDGQLAIEEHELISLVDSLYKSDSYYPILLIQGDAEEKEVINLINKSFNNQIITINADLYVAGAVLKNLDLVICANQSYLQLADLCETSSLCVHPNTSFYQNGSSLINSLTAVRRTEEANIGPSLYATIEYYFENTKITRSELDLYLTAQDELGIIYRPLYSQNARRDIEYFLSRQVAAKVFAQTEIFHAVGHEKEMSRYITEQKEPMTTILRTLLSTIRSFINAKNSTRNTHEFLIGMDKLFNFSNEKNLCSSVVHYFKARIENAPYGNSEENHRYVEKCLFELKNNLQTISQILVSTSERIHRSANPAANTKSELSL
ncbi:MAG: hypothetical protein JNM93_10190 [Bacteriovoracaceae bacterium]|nr:hypothetical protein [Bacteriovoracaceae bacterium]